MKLALFFTRGVSLKTWVDTGLFDREKLIYEEHLKNGTLEKVYWLTYGSLDAEIAKKLYVENSLHPGIQVIGMPRFFKGKVGILIYSFLMPIVQSTYLKQADIYKTNQIDGSWSAVFAKWFYRKPLIVRTGYVRSIFATKMKKSKFKIILFQLIEKLAYCFASYAIVTSINDKHYISAVYKFPYAKIFVIPNYVDTNLFKPINHNNKYFDRVIFVGRLSTEKNLFNLINAITETGFTLDIYGKGELEAALKFHAKRKGVNINFMGTVPNRQLPNVLNKYKFFILPSLFEGTPKSLLEAMACGLLCIGTNVEGIREVIKDNDNGLLCDVTISSIASIINMVKKHGDSLSCRLGKSARRYVIEYYALDRSARKEKDLFEKFMD